MVFFFVFFHPWWAELTRRVNLRLSIHLISIPGFFCIRHADLLMKDEAKSIYQDILSQGNESPKLKWQVCY